MADLIYVCSECMAELKRRDVPEDDDGSARAEFFCDEHGVRVTQWDGGTADVFDNPS